MQPQGRTWGLRGCHSHGAHTADGNISSKTRMGSWDAPGTSTKLHLVSHMTEVHGAVSALGVTRLPHVRSKQTKNLWLCIIYQLWKLMKTFPQSWLACVGITCLYDRLSWASWAVWTGAPSLFEEARPKPCDAQQAHMRSFLILTFTMHEYGIFVLNLHELIQPLNRLSQKAYYHNSRISMTFHMTAVDGQPARLSKYCQEAYQIPLNKSFQLIS